MKKFYYSDGVNELGPFSYEELKQKKITKDHLVWFAPMKEWQPAGSVDELKGLFTSINISKPTKPSSPTEIGNISQKPNFGNTDTPDILDSQSTFERPTNYLWQSIVVTIISSCNIFSLPFAIAGIVNATKVNPAYSSGDYARAERASKMAKQWTTVAFVIWCVYFVLGFLMGLAGG